MFVLGLVSVTVFMFLWQGFSDAGLAMADVARRGHPPKPWRIRIRYVLTGIGQHWPGYSENVRQELAQLGRDPTQYALQAALAAALLALTLGLDWSGWLAPIGLVLGIVGVRFVLHRQYQGWLTQVTGQMGDVAVLLKARLQAGETVPQAVRGVTPQVPNPTRVEWTRMVDGLNARLPLTQVVADFLARVPDRDVAAVLQQLIIYDRESVPPDPFGTLTDHLGRMKDLKREYLVQRSTQSIGLYTGLAFLLATVSVLVPVLYGLWVSTLTQTPL